MRFPEVFIDGVEGLEGELIQTCLTPLLLVVLASGLCADHPFSKKRNTELALALNSNPSSGLSLLIPMQKIITAASKGEKWVVLPSLVF